MQRRDFLRRTGGMALSLIPASRIIAGRQSQDGSATRLLAALQAGFAQDLPDWMRDSAVPGAGVAVVSNASVAWKRGFGFSDAAAKNPVTTETMFEAASVSKPVFAYVVMKLCERGILDLDTPLTKYTSARFLPNDPRLDLIIGLADLRERRSGLFFHGGDNDGFHCFVVGSVAGRSALVVMTNGEGGAVLLNKAIMAPYTQAFLAA